MSPHAELAKKSGNPSQTFFRAGEKARQPFQTFSFGLVKNRRDEPSRRAGEKVRQPFANFSSINLHAKSASRFRTEASGRSLNLTHRNHQTIKFSDALDVSGVSDGSNHQWDLRTLHSPFSQRFSPTNQVTDRRILATCSPESSYFLPPTSHSAQRIQRPIGRCSPTRGSPPISPTDAATNRQVPLTRVR